MPYNIQYYIYNISKICISGWQCSPILLPLLLQGLSDPEEFVISRCINTMASLTSLQLLQKVALYELLKETTPYLLHPNLWIRQATGKLLQSGPGKFKKVQAKEKTREIK